MERASKSGRNVPNGERNVDRLSALPDGVICHILSFLETKRSVQTSILSKRWRFLWAHVPVLDFSCYYANSKTKSNRFPGMVCAFMLRHKVQSLITFSLKYFGGGDTNKGGGGGDDDSDDDGDGDGDDDGPCYELETCISTVAERNVQKLFLCVDLRVEVPRRLLTCKTLVVLTMFRGVSIPPTAPISWPNLKKLHLDSLECEIDFTRLLSGCPVLEEFYTSANHCIDPSGCCISSPTLKKLTIVRLLAYSMFDSPDYMVTINTPALTYLHVLECSSKYISISPCSSIVEANISFDYYHCEPDDFSYRCVLNLLDSIRYVKCLNLSVHCGKIWDGPMPGLIAKFDNLTKLDLRANWFLLTKFLESADHLEVLTIHEAEWHSKHWMEPIEESVCLLHSLRTLRIHDLTCTEQDFNMVRYVLRNARVLELMKISCLYWDVNKKFDVIRKITLFPRESKKCELDFS